MLEWKGWPPGAATLAAFGIGSDTKIGRGLLKESDH